MGKRGDHRVVFTFYDICESIWVSIPAVTAIVNLVYSSVCDRNLHNHGELGRKNSTILSESSFSSDSFKILILFILATQLQKMEI